LHLGNYHGAVKNWVNLQYEYESFIGVVDLHALTTDYANPDNIYQNTWDVVIDLLASGINPGSTHLFIQSRIPEHAELHTLLSMITPLSWLERVPTYKDQIQNLKEKDLSTYGFLGYPLLMSADILLYKTAYVPVGEDQLPHIEIAREIARRFNHLYGRDKDFEEKAEKAITHLAKKQANLYRNLRKRYQEEGDKEALETAQAFLGEQHQLSISDKERLLGYLEGGGKIILPEPEGLLTETPVLPGLDGRKMSKSYKNTISLREDPKSVEKKVLTMPTDPARVRRTDPGDPEKCPVWKLHQVYSDDETKCWVQNGCKSAGIGCIDCKRPLLDEIIKEQAPIREKAIEFEQNPEVVKRIVAEGCEAAREVARDTIVEVKEAMGILD